eukprot:TRINITY_DN33749_c3_g1_i1.p1 TRINITY_DN33749_c3_g1~~TRINITY_DN33749_c3_g1_i1.p1  ORF type:complete len:213 (-),score=19.29 TRINITY_DN33749_c3_g1_i1:288-926(-)
MPKHNNVIPNAHFKKKWQFMVKTWFNQPARRVRRRKARELKAQRVFPRPASGLLRPIVHPPTVKYNMKKRLGKGFSLEELKEAGIPAKLAPTIGIAVDKRRRNKSLEGLQENVNRLKAYRSNLILFPRKAGNPKAGDSSPEECATATQFKGTIMPVVKETPTVEMVEVTEDMKNFWAYRKLRLERTNARWVGKRAKRAAEAEAEEAEKAKMK